MKFPDFDDKDLAMFCVTLIALGSMFCSNAPKDILIPVVTGILALAVGRKLK